MAVWPWRRRLRARNPGGPSRVGAQFTLYDLIKASVLFINALAILNEQRFLAKCAGDGAQWG
jgi:hypothetical protein